MTDDLMARLRQAEKDGRLIHLPDLQPDEIHVAAWVPPAGGRPRAVHLVIHTPAADFLLVFNGPQTLRRVIARLAKALLEVWPAHARPGRRGPVQ